MASLLDFLPAPKRVAQPKQDPLAAALSRPSSSSSSSSAVSALAGAASSAASVPPYGKRDNWRPEPSFDHGDGGAYPEVPVLQYPLGMDKKGGSSASSKALVLSSDATGQKRFDAIARQGQRSNAIIHSTLSDMSERDAPVLQRPSAEEEAEITKKTQEALNKIVTTKIAAASNSGIIKKQDNTPQYVRYTPAQQGEGLNSGATNRIIRMVEAPVDPMEPAKFKLKKAPRGPGSPPVPIMHSPSRKLTAKDNADWTIPPCISNWKNPKGHTIPLDKRLAADGRGLNEVTINDGFAKFSEILYIAERTAREEIELRKETEKKIKEREAQAKEEQLRKLAEKARLERAGISSASAAAPAAPEPSYSSSREAFSERRYKEEDRDYSESAPRYREDNRDREDRGDRRRDDREDRGRGRRDEHDEVDEDRKRRDQLREERRREREREMRMQASGKGRGGGDDDRDISEKIALGQAAPTSADSLYDSRLFNQSEGVGSGFGAEDDYAVYDKRLFTGGTAGMLYKPKKDDGGFASAEDTMARLQKNQDRFQREEEGGSASASGSRGSRPVEFERNRDADEDHFGLAAMLSETSRGKNPLDSIGKRGQMSAAGESNHRDADNYRGGDGKRGRIEFESGGSKRGRREE